MGAGIVGGDSWLVNTKRPEAVGSMLSPVFHLWPCSDVENASKSPVLRATSFMLVSS